jgi:hypothetical protein
LALFNHLEEAECAAGRIFLALAGPAQAGSK